MSLQRMKILTFLLLLLPFVLGGENPLIYPNWSENVSCTFETCFYRAEFAHIRENSKLILFNQTASLVKFGDISNLVTLRKVYDGVLPIISELETAYQVEEGVFVDFTDPIFSVFRIEKIDPQIFMQVGDEKFTVSEATHTDDLFTFTPHEITFNQTNFAVGKYITILQNPGTYHPTLNCTVNPLGVYSNEKLGAFQKVGNKINYGNLSFGLTEDSTRWFEKPIFVADRKTFALPVFPVIPANVSIHPEISGCNTTVENGVLRFYNQCDFEFNLGHYDVPINVSGTVKPTYPIYHINDALYVDQVPMSPRLKYKFYDREESYTTNYQLTFAETRYSELNTLSSSNILYKVCANDVCDITATSRNFELRKNQVVVYTPVPGPATFRLGKLLLTNQMRCIMNHANTNHTFNVTYTFTLDALAEDSPSTARFYSLYRNGTVSYIESKNFTASTPVIWSREQKWDEDICLDGNYAGAAGNELLVNMSRINSDYTKSVKELEIDMLSFGNGVGSVQIALAGLIGYGYASKLHYNASSLLPSCTQLPWFSLGSPAENVMAIREMKNINGSFRYDYLTHGNNTAAFDPDFSVSGVFSLPNNGSNCPYITGISTKQTGKQSIKVKYTMNNICTNSTMNSWVGANAHVLINGTCTGEVKKECELEGNLVGTENFILRIVMNVDGSVTQEDHFVSYDWDEDCFVPIICWIPYLRDVPTEWQLFVVIAILFLFVLGCLACVTPAVLVGQAFEKTATGTVWCAYKISWPFYMIGKGCYGCTYWMVDCYCQRYRRKKKQMESKMPKSRTMNAGSDRKITSQYEEVMDFDTIKPRGKSWFQLCILFMTLSGCFACENTILGQSNVTICTAGSCSIDLDVAFSLPVSHESRMCLSFTQVDTQLDVVTIEQENVNMTVLDFFLDYPMDFQYLAPWTTLIQPGTGCDCSDGTSHECEKEHHPSGAGLHGSGLFYWWTKSSGTGKGCEQLLLSGDGHYCTSYDLVHDTQISVSAITNSPTYHLHMQVCKDNNVCEDFWHNTTQHITHTLFDGEVDVTIDGFLVGRLPDLSGKFLVKTSGTSWIDVVNRKGDTTLSGPGFIQYYGGTNNKTWHGASEQILKGIGTEHKHCYDPAEIKYTLKYPVFSSWVTKEKEANSILAQYGRAEIRGFAETTTLRLFPNEVPDALGTFITKAGWMSIQIENACPVIGDISANNLFQDSTAATLEFDAWSSCGEGEAVFSVHCDYGCVPQEDLRVVLTDEDDVYSIHVKATGDEAEGSICAVSYFESICKPFSFVTIPEEFDGGIAEVTIDDKTDNKDTSDDSVCWTCWDDWTSFAFHTDSLWGIIESILFLGVKILVLILMLSLFAALAKQLILFIIRSLMGDRSSDKNK